MSSLACEFYVFIFLCIVTSRYFYLSGANSTKMFSDISFHSIPNVVYFTKSPKHRLIHCHPVWTSAIKIMQRASFAPYENDPVMYRDPYCICSDNLVISQTIYSLGCHHLQKLLWCYWIRLLSWLISKFT